MKRLNDEQLSRVLSALEGGTLGSPHETEYHDTACLVQTADLMPGCALDSYRHSQVEQAKWFDSFRLPRFDAPRLALPVDEFLAELKKVGLA